MQLSIIIPVYNEEKRIGQSLQKIMDFRERELDEAEVIFVDDGSTDRTLKILTENKNNNIRIVRVWPNKGKGNAVRAGVLEANGGIIIYMDSDLATPLEEISRILEAIKDDDIAIGTRFLDKNNVKRDLLRAIAGQIFSIIKSMILPLRISDTQCGFKAFKGNVAKELFALSKVQRWSFDAEILFLAKKFGYTIKEISVSWQEKGDSKVRLLRDSIQMIKDLLLIRYSDLTGQYELPIDLQNNNLNEKQENA